MPTVVIPTPASVRETLAQIVEQNEKADREKLARALPPAYAKLVLEVETLGGSIDKIANALTPAEFGRRLTEDVVGKAKRGEREKSSGALLDAWTALFYDRDGRTAKAMIRTGGRSGTVRFSPAKLDTGNARFDDLVAAERAGRRIDPYERTIIDPINGEPRACRPRRLAVTVEKPGDLTDLRDAGLDPEFLEYLRVQRKLYLRSIDDFLEHEVAAGHANAGDPPTPAQRAAFEEERAAAFDAFAKAQFLGRYCRPQDIPVQTGQRGHRLLRLALPLQEEDFRDLGCGPVIYEGPFGQPIPPDIDYATLVARYVKDLKALPRVYYNLEGLSELEVQAAHSRDLAQADPLIVRMFVAATLITLGHDAFRQQLSAFAQQEG